MCFLDPGVWGQGGDTLKEDGWTLSPVGAFHSHRGQNSFPGGGAGPGAWAILCAPQAGLPSPKGHGHLPEDPRQLRDWISGSSHPAPPSSQSWKQGLGEQV